MSVQGRLDLVVLVADKDMEFAFRGIIEHKESLEIRDISVEVYRHPEHDPGCLLRAHDFLRSFINQFRYAIVAFDRHGCGRGNTARTELEGEVELLLEQNGWPGHSAAIVIEPELENWVWSDSPHVAAKLGWKGRKPTLKQWLVEEQLLVSGATKPLQPKEAMQKALRHVRKPRSSSLFGQLAREMPVERCEDPAFQKLKTVLRKWFG